MKYLKKFNERLSPEVYKRAGSRLIGLDKEERGSKLYDYGNELEHGFYNIHFANTNSTIFTEKFTNPKVSSHVYSPNSTSGFRDLKSEQDIEDFVQDWYNGDSSLKIFFNFKFEMAKSAADYNKDFIKRYGDYTPFMICLELCEQSPGEFDEGLDITDVYDRYKYIGLYLQKSKSYYGIFADRKSALKFKRILPSLLEPELNKIYSVLSIIGAPVEDFEKIKEKINSVRVNHLYGEKTGFKKNWFDKPELTSSF